MADDNVEIARRSYDAYRSGDFERALRDVHPEIVVYRDEPDGATFHGHEGLSQAISQWIEDFDEFELTADEITPIDDEQVMVRVHQRAVGAQSGAAIEADFWFLHRFVDGKGVRLDMFLSRDRANEAAGIDAG
jgi:ketosteroid isomerase-like protein